MCSVRGSGDKNDRHTREVLIVDGVVVVLLALEPLVVVAPLDVVAAEVVVPVLVVPVVVLAPDVVAVLLSAAREDESAALLLDAMETMTEAVGSE